MDRSIGDHPHFNFLLSDVLAYSRGLSSDWESIAYLRWIQNARKRNKTILDQSIGDPNHDFDLEIELQILRLQASQKLNSPIEATPEELENCVFNYDYDKIIAHSKLANNVQLEIMYLAWVIKERLNNPPELDNDLYNGHPPLAERLQNDINYLRVVHEMLNAKK